MRFCSANLQTFLADLAVGVLLEEQADPGDAGIGDQALDLQLDLIEVRGADVEDVFVQRRAQEFGAGERREEGDIGLVDQRNRRLAGRRADIAEQREHAVLLDQFFGGGGGARRIVAVVLADQRDLAAVDAAGGVDLLEVGLAAGLDAQSQAGGRSRLGVGHADLDSVGGDAGFG